MYSSCSTYYCPRKGGKMCNRTLFPRSFILHVLILDEMTVLSWVKVMFTNSLRGSVDHISSNTPREKAEKEISEILFSIPFRFFFISSCGGIFPLGFSYISAAGSLLHCNPPLTHLTWPWAPLPLQAWSNRFCLWLLSLIWFFCFFFSIQTIFLISAPTLGYLIFQQLICWHYILCREHTGDFVARFYSMTESYCKIMQQSHPCVPGLRCSWVG